MKVRNTITGEVREVKPASVKTLGKAVFDGIDRCVGPCKCRVECDGVCANGWQSRCMAEGIME